MPQPDANRSSSIKQQMDAEPKLPTSPTDKNWPKEPKFKPVLYGFLAAIIIVVLLGILLISRYGKRIFPMNTHSTPSQTRLVVPTRTASLLS